MTNKVKWGILGAASIAQRRVLPAMMQCELSEVAAIASRSTEKAKAASALFFIPKAYDSYESCSPIRKSRRSTIRCRIICMSSGPFVPLNTGSTFYARSRLAARSRRPGVCWKPATGVV